MVTDLLILHRREPRPRPDPVAWEQSRLTSIDGAQVPVSEYFLNHPEHVLGTMRATRGAYRAGDLVVHPAGDTVSCLTQALDEIARTAADRDLRWQPAAASGPGPAARPPATADPDGYIRAHADGTFTKALTGTAQPHPVPASQARELRPARPARHGARCWTPRPPRPRTRRRPARCARAEPPVRRVPARFRAGQPVRAAPHRPRRPVTGERVMARIQPPQGAGAVTWPFPAG